MDLLEATLVAMWLILLVAVSISQLNTARALHRQSENESACLAERALPENIRDLKPLVNHYLCTGVVDRRPADHLPIDLPLAPEAPKPTVVPLNAILPRPPSNGGELS